MTYSTRPPNRRAEAGNYRPGMVVPPHQGGLANCSRAKPWLSRGVQSRPIIPTTRQTPVDPAKHAGQISGRPLPGRSSWLAGDPNPDSAECQETRSGEWQRPDMHLVSGPMVAIETREGKTLPPTFRDVSHGYVVTSHKSQGRTHDRVIVAAQADGCQDSLRRLLPWPTSSLPLHSGQSLSL